MIQETRRARTMNLIAIIDDDESVVSGLEGLVRSLGYLACTFTSPQDFLMSSERGVASCVVTDVQMPDMSGLELQRILVADGLMLPIVFITAFPEDRIRNEAFQAGACGFLSKPFSAQDLATCLEDACTKRSGPQDRP